MIVAITFVIYRHN